MKLIVGIDFGTSTTVVRYRVDGSDVIQTIKDKDGVSDIIPSFIFKQFDGLCLYGGEAIKRWQAGIEGKLISNFKMGLIEKNEEKRRENISYIEEFLKYVHGLFEQQTIGLNATECDVYFSYPAKWDFDSITVMEKAVRKAGFSGNIVGMTEPKAAVLNYWHTSSNKLKARGMLKVNKSINVLMLDMGAGTSDIVIFSLKINKEGKPIIENQVSYPKAGNPYHCGGREIDVLLSEYVKDYLKKMNVKYDYDEYEGEDDIFTIYDAKKWKEDNLSPILKKNEVAICPTNLKIVLKYMENGKNAAKEFTMGRNDFEEITKKHWENLYSLISSAINDYKRRFNIGAEDIDLLLLTGAHSQWYTVKNLFNGEGVAGYIGKQDYKNGDTTVKALDFKKLKKDTSLMFSDALPHESVAKGLVTKNQIETHLFAPNNVWAQITINGGTSGIMDLIKCEEELPTAKKTIEFSKTFLKVIPNQIYIAVFIFTGEKLDNAILRSYNMKTEEGSVLFRISLMLSILYIILFSLRWDLKVTMEIQMDEEETLNISGLIDIDNGRRKFPFTFDDFTTIE